MANSITYKIFADLTDSVNSVIAKKYIFLQNRPTIKEGDAPMSRFIVIGLPISIRDSVKGYKKRRLTTTGVFHLFTQARSNSTLDVNANGDFTDEITNLFPIKGKCCSASNPEVLIAGSDGQGFQVVTITFDLETRWDAFKQQ